MAEKGWGVALELTTVAAVIPVALGTAAINKLTGGEFDDRGMLQSAAETAGEFGDHHSATLTTVAKGVFRALRRSSLPGPTP